MKYQAPYGVTDPNAIYINGNPATGVKGSIPPAASIEFPQREIVNFITDSGITPDDGDLHQLSRAVQCGKVWFGVDTGTANAMVCVLNPVPTALIPGMTIRVKKIGSKNTGPATLNVGVGGANTIKRASGADLVDADLPASIVAEFTFDGSYWQVTNFQGFSATNTTVNNFTLTIPYAADSSGVANTIQANFSPALTSLAAGDMVKIKLANTITGAARIFCNAMAAVNVCRPDGSPSVAGDAVANQMCIFLYDGVNFQLVNSPLGGLSIRRLSFAQYEHSAIEGVWGVGLAAGTAAVLEVCKVSGVPKATGRQRRISWVVSGQCLSGPVLGEVGEYRIQRSVDSGANWTTMITTWIGGQNLYASNETHISSSGGTVWDSLDTADQYRIGAIAMGDSVLTSNHARLAVEELA